MKQFFISIAIISALAFTGRITTADKASATVNQAQGMYLFVESKPLAEYEYLGTVKTSGAFHVGSGQYEPIRDALIKKVKSDYPQADGIIFTFQKGGSDKADAIKFK